MTPAEKARSVVEALEAEINHSGAGASLFEVLPIARALVECVKALVRIRECEPHAYGEAFRAARQALQTLEEA